VMARGQVAALGRLDGVQEATLCSPDGMVLESSSGSPELTQSAMSLQAALGALQGTLPNMGGPVTLTVDTPQGTLHLSQSSVGVLVVSTTSAANQGAVRLEMREALRALGG